MYEKGDLFINLHFSLCIIFCFTCDKNVQLRKKSFFFMKCYLKFISVLTYKIFKKIPRLIRDLKEEVGLHFSIFFERFRNLSSKCMCMSCEFQLEY